MKLKFPQPLNLPENCHSERSEESTHAPTLGARGRGFFAALRMTNPFVCFVVALSSTAFASSLRVTDLKCEYATDPLGVDLAQPRLFWRVASDERGQRQTAYRILVASSAENLTQNRGDLWDSGRVDSDATTQIRYAGNTLASSEKVFWKVESWDREGAESGWSAPAT